MRHTKRCCALFGLLLLWSCESEGKWIDKVKAPCAGQWQTVTVEIRGDTARVVSVCKT